MNLLNQYQATLVKYYASLNQPDWHVARLPLAIELAKLWDRMTPQEQEQAYKQQERIYGRMIGLSP